MNWKKFRRKARRLLCRHRRALALLLTFVACVIIISAARQDGVTSGNYDHFLDALAQRESSDNYTKVNRYGYLGRYQMGRSALEDAGFRHEGGGWTALANSYGIYDREDFLNSPAGQDAAVKAYHTKVCDYIRHYGLEKYIGTTYCGVTVTRSGLLAACHLVGVGAMIDGLKSGEHTYDGNRVSAAEYMELFAGFDISEVWNG